MVNQRGQYLCVAAGGFGGAVTRHYIGMLVTSGGVAFPLGTLAVNLLGSGMLGFFLTVTLSHWKIAPAMRVGIASGFLGAFTTYSTFAVDFLIMLNTGLYSVAFFYVLANLVGGVLLAWAGIRLARLIKGSEKAGEEK